MQKFKSKAPDLIGFQWVEGVSLKDKLVELIGDDDFQLTIDDMGLVFLEHKEYYMDIFPGDWVVKYPDGRIIIAIEPEELNENYVKVY